MKTINSLFWLGGGVLLLVVITSSYLSLFILPTFYILVVKGKHDYVKNVWLSFDCMWNAILMGHPKETFSSRLGKIWWYNAPTRIPKWLCWRLLRLLDVIDPNHCRNSIDWTYGWKTHAR